MAASLNLLERGWLEGLDCMLWLVVIRLGTHESGPFVEEEEKMTTPQG